MTVQLWKSWECSVSSSSIDTVVVFKIVFTEVDYLKHDYLR